MQDAGNHVSGADRPMARPSTSSCQSIDWYSEGESRVVEVGDVSIEVRFVGRKGRQGRIAIVGPPGTTYRSVNGRGAE
jgi:hypothetical protein